MKHTTFSPEETIALGEAFGKTIPQNSVICFFGDLGAGKTTFIKGMAKGAAQYIPENVNSPTFTYLNIYSGTKQIYHFDLYRLHDLEEFMSMGFDDFFYQEGICCIEWSEKIEKALPPETFRVSISHKAEGVRQIEIHSPKSLFSNSSGLWTDVKALREKSNE